MFDIGFWELCFICVIALLVFGPERLPGVARSVGLWVGRARRMFNSVTQEINQELRLQEAQEAIRKSQEQTLYNFIEETDKTNSAKSTESSEQKRT